MSNLKQLDCWAVWNYYEHRDGVRREHVEAVCATKEQAVDVARELMLRELTDETIPHLERSRLFVRAIRVVGLVPER